MKLAYMSKLFKVNLLLISLNNSKSENKFLFSPPSR